MLSLSLMEVVRTGRSEATLTVQINGQTEAERLEEQKTRFFEIINTNLGKEPERAEKLLRMYEDYGDRLISAPASGKIHYHNAYAGGYIDHILHVYDAAVDQAKLLRKMSGTVDFSLAELTMAALHHDLWKLGMPNGEPYYLTETSDWHRKNQGSMFKINEKLPFFKVTDGALFILQSYDIKLTYNETMAIKLSDGLYDENNRSYLMHFGKFPIHTNLAYVIHWADHLSTTVEREPLKQEFLDSL